MTIAFVSYTAMMILLVIMIKRPEIGYGSADEGK